MKAKLVLDQGCNPATAPEYLRNQIKFRMAGGGNRVAYYPKGTEFEGEQAVALCRTGQAEPTDGECAKAVGKSPEELQRIQQNYEMESKGIVSDEDKELYLAGVIVGFKDGEYVPGPRWDEYQAEVAKDDDDLEGV